jgi:hypothetical protein
MKTFRPSDAMSTRLARATNLSLSAFCTSAAFVSSRLAQVERACGAYSKQSSAEVATLILRWLE